MSALASLTISNDGFAFNVMTGESYTLNRCAQMILQRLHAGETQAQIVPTIAREFGITETIVERDVTDFCQQLHLLGLLGAKA